MPKIESLFVTRIYKAKLEEFGKAINFIELENSCLTIAVDDMAGQDWCEKNGFIGYTSYASLVDLPWRFDIFKELVKSLDKHVNYFSKDLAFDLDVKKIKLDSLWINILPGGGVHTSHIHPNSILSGTVYVAMPPNVSSIKFEDPRLAMMMAAPSRKINAPKDTEKDLKSSLTKFNMRALKMAPERPFPN